MTHQSLHPVPVADCFGCKVLTVGYDGRHTSRTRPVLKDDAPGPAGTMTEHRDGRIDATATPDLVVLRGKAG